jgi:hypothetical protein
MRSRFVALLLVLAACGTAAPTATRPAATTTPPSTTEGTATTTTAGPVSTTLVPFVRPPTGLCEGYAEPEVVATVSDDRLVEVSGIVRSRQHPGITWMHNDSGDGPVVYAVDDEGRTASAYNLGILTLDPEDLAIGPGPGGDVLYFADIGDNFAFRPIVSLYRFAEPDPLGGTLGDVERIDLVYPDGPVDSEAVAIDPVTGDLLLATKAGSSPTRVYRAGASELVAGGSVDLELVVELELGASVTAIDITPSGDRVAMRGYHELWLWPRSDVDLASVLGSAPCLLASPEERQGEAVTFGANGSIYTVSEGAGPAIFELAGP